MWFTSTPSTIAAKLNQPFRRKRSRHTAGGYQASLIPLHEGGGETELTLQGLSSASNLDNHSKR